MLFAALAGVGLSIFSQKASAQVLSANGSGVKAYFASQSEAFKDSDPTGATWGIAGVGPYTLGVPLPTLPPAPTPSISAPGGNFFSTNGFGGYASLFNDLLGPNNLTAAKFNIDDNYLTSPLATSDAAITIPNWRLFQMPAAPGYAYNQLNFGSNYLITTNPGLAPNPSPNFPLSINGSVVNAPGAYVQCSAVIDYSWIPVTINTAGVISASGPTVSLGTLTWSYSQTFGGSFAQTLISSGSLAATPAGDGMLILTGEAWLAGDPFDITMTLAPEPASLIGIGVVGAIATLRRRRK